MTSLVDGAGLNVQDSTLKCPRADRSSRKQMEEETHRRISACRDASGFRGRATQPSQQLLQSYDTKHMIGGGLGGQVGSDREAAAKQLR